MMTRQERTCIGCGAREDRGAADLVRLVLGPNGELAVDAAGGAFGRGAHVHARAGCLDKAQRGLARSYKRSIEIQPAELAAQIGEAMDRRVRGLLASAVRARAIAIGAEAVSEACRRGEASLVVVATDAAAAAELGEVRRAVAAGRAVAWGTKRAIADGIPGGHRDGGIAVIAIASPSIADAVRAAVQAASAVANGTATARERARPAPGGKQELTGASRTKGAAGSSDGGQTPFPSLPEPSPRDRAARLERGE